LRVYAAIEVLLFGRGQGDCQTAMVTKRVACALTMKSEGEGEGETETTILGDSSNERLYDWKRKAERDREKRGDDVRSYSVPSPVRCGKLCWTYLRWSLLDTK
jgi:hypothetical protein